MRIYTDDEVHNLCMAVIRLTQMGLKYCSDFGYENAIDKYEALKKKKWICPVCKKTFGEEIQHFYSDFQGCCGRGLTQIT